MAEGWQAIRENFLLLQDPPSLEASLGGTLRVERLGSPPAPSSLGGTLRLDTLGNTLPSPFPLDGRPSTVSSGGRSSPPEQKRPESSPQPQTAWGRASAAATLSSLEEEPSTLPALARTWSSGMKWTSSTKAKGSGTIRMPPATPAGEKMRGSSSGKRFPPKTPESILLSDNFPTDSWHKVRAAEILLPSGSPANDRSRVRNGGKALQSRVSIGLLNVSKSAPDLFPLPLPALPSSPSDAAPASRGEPRRSTSEGFFPAAPSSSEGFSPLEAAVPDGGAGGRTPRTTRGVLRSISRIMAQYPEMDPTSAEGRKPVKISYKGPPSPPRQKSVKDKPISWMDLPDPEFDGLKTLTSTMTCDNGQNSDAFMKSTKMLQNLRNLRRMVQAEAETPEALGEAEPPEQPDDPAMAKTLDLRKTASLARTLDLGSTGSSAKFSKTLDLRPKSPPKEEKADALMIQTLTDLDDHEAKLRTKYDQIMTTVRFVAACGGDKHATTIVSKRIAQVMKRKADLLQAVERRIAKLEATRPVKEELVAKLVSGELKEENIPEGLVNNTRFVKDHTHRPGEPVDAPRVFFDLFCSTFKLPREHKALKDLRALADELGDWWARATNEEARKGPPFLEREVIERLMRVSVSVGAEDDHPYLLRATDILRERIAEKCIREARRILENEKIAGAREEERGRVRKVGLAADAGDAVEAAVTEAKEQGVRANHPSLIEATAIAKELRELDGVRRRMESRNERTGNQSGKKASVIKQ